MPASSSTKVETSTIYHVRSRAGRIAVDLTIGEENKVEDISIKIQRNDQGSPVVIDNIVEVDLNDLALAIDSARRKVDQILHTQQSIQRGGA